MATPTTFQPSHYPKDKTDMTRGITMGNFRIWATNMPILKARPIEEMTEKLGIAPPEMIFGDNQLTIQHKNGWGMTFNSFDALDSVDKTGEKMLQVAHSEDWKKSRETTHEGISKVVKPFDWSYTSDYKGTMLSEVPRFITYDALNDSTAPKIPTHLLSNNDTIRFFHEVPLYEDELADNGMSMLSVKVRVMDQRMLLLMRFALRLDGVIIRQRDTRVYIDFETEEVMRDYKVKEDEYEVIKKNLKATHRGDIAAILRDPNELDKYLTLREHTMETLKILPQTYDTLSSIR
ncbi:MAG: hypothetical protein M1834_002396 [Cirrosporium novae-zelandiae]|nr:MAG: hypothetical protein M1834_002396 [Cirrosporium novae-zelandiae]